MPDDAQSEDPDGEQQAALHQDSAKPSNEAMPAPRHGNNPDQQRHEHRRRGARASQQQHHRDDRGHHHRREQRPRDIAAPAVSERDARHRSRLAVSVMNDGKNGSKANGAANSHGWTRFTHLLARAPRFRARSRACAARRAHPLAPDRTHRGAAFRIVEQRADLGERGRFGDDSSAMRRR